MAPSLRALSACPGLIQAVRQVSSGPPAFVLWQAQVTPRTIESALALVRRGMPMLQAERAMEALLAEGRVFLEVPPAEDRDALAAELRAAGVAAALLGPVAATDLAWPVGWAARSATTSSFVRSLGQRRWLRSHWLRLSVAHTPRLLQDGAQPTEPQPTHPTQHVRG